MTPTEFWETYKAWIIFAGIATAWFLYAKYQEYKKKNWSMNKVPRPPSRVMPDKYPPTDSRPFIEDYTLDSLEQQKRAVVDELNGIAQKMALSEDDYNLLEDEYGKECKKIDDLFKLRKEQLQKKIKSLRLRSGFKRTQLDNIMDSIKQENMLIEFDKANGEMK